MSTLSSRLSYTLFEILQIPNHLEFALQICISCTYMYDLWWVKSILWYLPRSWNYTTFTRQGTGSSVQVLEITKKFLEKNINKVSKYCVIFFWIIFLDSTLLICQKFRIIIRLPWLAGAAIWPPAPTSSWWCYWAPLWWLCVKFFYQFLFVMVPHALKTTW